MMDFIISALQSALDSQDVAAAQEISLKLVNGNAILPLISCVQRAAAEYKHAKTLLCLLVKVSHMILSTHGWIVVGTGENKGSYKFRNR